VQMPADNGQNHEDLYTELIVSGLIYLDQESDVAVEVKRGLVILTGEGQEAGRVAAVILDRHNHQVTHILLSSLKQIEGYRLVPITMIEQVYEETVLLRILHQDVNSLPIWHGS
jgi:hypothetical protein